MTIEQDIHEFMLEGMPTNAKVSRDKGNFEDIFNDKTVASWGWTVPLRHNGQRVVYLIFSPAKKGDTQTVFYDFISDEEYLKER